MTALEYLRLHAIEFNDLSDDIVNQMISSAGLFSKTDGLTTEQANFATGMYAAHLLWVRKYQNGGLRGSISYERDGDLGKRYNALDNSQSFIGQSPYGQMYLNIAGNTGGSIMTRFDYDNSGFNC